DQEKHIGLKTPSRRRTADDLRGYVSARLEAWKIALAADQDAGSLQPTFGKRGLQKFDRRTFDARVGIAPVLRRASVADPRIGDAIAAGKTNPPVDHQNAPVAP